MEPIDGIGREAIQSSNIKSLGYDPERQTLAVEFKSGDVIHYKPVDGDLALEFYAAESKGKFYHQRIRGKIQGQMMTGPCSSCGSIGVLGMQCAACHEGTHREKARRRDDSHGVDTQIDL